MNEWIKENWLLFWNLKWILKGAAFAVIVAVLFYITNRLIKKEMMKERIQIGIAILSFVMPVSYCFINSTKAIFLEYLIIAGVSTYSIYKCGYLPFHLKEHISIVGLLMITTTHGYGVVMESITLLPLLLIIILFVKLENYHLKGKWLNIWMYTFTICFHICLIRKIYETLLKDFNYYLAEMFGSRSFIRLLFFLLVAILFFAFSLGLVYMERKYLTNWYTSICNLSKGYTAIDWYFIAATVFDCILIFAVNHSYVLHTFFDERYELYYFRVVECFAVVLIAIQFLFVILLTQVSEQKIRIQKQELQNENMLVYHKKLEENLTDIRAMKHDLKNVFLTMGEYVQRSDDAEMKAFYQEAICPLADKEIKMNDCFMALENIRNDQLKAFLFYKLSYGISCDIDMKLFLSTTNQNQVDIPGDWEFVETLVRILGIWIDNAMEECEAIKAENNSAVKCTIHIKQNEQSLQFQVKNTVREKMQDHGIEKGTTTKGLGRGNGLLYVDKMMKKFQNAIWNSYFKDGLFIQSMMIDFGKEV